jgi:hypothetical protein
LPGHSRSINGSEEKEQDEEEVTPAEDLMREHGLLKLILFIYEEVENRISQQREFPPDAVTTSAKIIRAFIEQYRKCRPEHLPETARAERR